MAFVYMLIGAILGAFFCAGVFGEKTGLTAAVFGLIFGLLFARLQKMGARIALLERELKNAPKRAAATAGDTTTRIDTQAAKSAGTTTAPTPAAPDSALTPDRPAMAAIEPLARGSETPTAAATSPSPGASADTAAGPPVFAAPTPPRVEASVPGIVMTRPAEPVPENIIVSSLKRWFTEGNVPVKVGVLVLFLGVAALLKYAADQGWLHVPMEYRLTGIALVALGALVFAWRKRESHRNFALSLQGGAIGVLILTAFAAYRLYGLLPAGLTFALLVVIVAGAAMLAVLQDALALAVLAIVGGFLAPILISTGSGNHVALFGYYALLNAAVFGIAWIRPWRALNLLGFAFTFGVGTFWGTLSYRPELFASTEPFLLLFFAFYLLIPLLYALRQAPERRDLIDGTLVFGTPLIAFALQVALLDRARQPLAFSAIGAAAIYTALAALELRRWKLDLLGQSHALLALGFATLAVPLALSARSTSSTWALEGAALIWLGLRQQRQLPRWLGCALQIAAAGAFVLAYSDARSAYAIINGQFLGALLVALAALASARLFARADVRQGAALFFVWGWLWLWFAFGDEIGRYGTAATRADWALAMIALTGVVAAELLRRWNWRECAWPAIALFPLALPLIAMTAQGNHGALEQWALLAWPLWLAAALRTLDVFAARGERSLPWLHGALFWIVAILLATELEHLIEVHAGLGEVWVALGSVTPFAVGFWLVLRRMQPALWPSAEAAQRSRRGLLASFAALLGLFWLFGLFKPGDPAPLPYLPLFNPVELAQLAYLFLLFAWFRDSEREGGALLDAELRARVIAIAGVVLLTSITLRGAHFLGGVPWSEALWDSPLAQAALSITWTLAGIVAMLLGKRRNSRAVWFGGAVLMGVVLVKLLLIDRRFLHDLPAIIGVLVVGVLLVAIGYFAPVPPRTAAAGENA